jgi:hypothetical protein
MKRLCLALVAFSFVASAAAAQSLAEVARQEEARRKAIKTPAKVYTDADLRHMAPATPLPGTGQPQLLAPAPATGEEAKAGGQQADAQADAQAAEGKTAGEQPTEKDEAWWRKRITDAREQLDRTRFLSDAMQTRINSLTNDWAARDDPAQRAVLAADRARALEELQRLQKDIDTQTKAIAAIEEEARRAGVPPGWLR